MRPLLMTRTKGITGPTFAKHAGIKGLSKSSGNAISARSQIPLGPDVLQGLGYFNTQADFDVWLRIGSTVNSDISWDAVSQYARFICIPTDNIDLMMPAVLEVGKRYRMEARVNLTEGGLALNGTVTGGVDVTLHSGYNTLEFVAALINFSIKREGNTVDAGLDSVIVQEMLNP